MSVRSLQSLKHVLGGKISGKELLCPGPGHSSKDRSLSITLSHQSPDGFVCYSYAGDDWRRCRDYVLERLGAQRELLPNAGQRLGHPVRHAPSDNDQERRCAAARRLWDGAR